MRSRKLCEKLNANLTDPVIDSNELQSTKNSILNRPTQEVLDYYKNKAKRVEKEFETTAELLENIKSVCDLSTELYTELNHRNEEVSRLQQVVSDLQIHLFREREYCLELSGENDTLKIQALEDKKKINALQLLTGCPNVEFLHLVSGNPNGIIVEKKLPPKLQKLKEKKSAKTQQAKDKKPSADPDEIDIQALILKNQSLASQLEHHICISRNQISVLLKDRELACEERLLEKGRLQKQIDLLSNKLKEVEKCLCETSEKLVETQRDLEKERDNWMEEKERYIKALKMFKEKNGDKYPDIIGYAVSGVGSKNRSHMETDIMREQMLEKEKIAAAYQDQVAAMEAEIINLKERAQSCRNTFKEKMEKMTQQTHYLKNKYEHLDRRRHLEAEGFRTDIRMLRERLKELEKKLTKANLNSSCQITEQQLLISARNTLNRARQLEKELIKIKSKMSVTGFKCLCR